MIGWGAEDIKKKKFKHFLVGFDKGAVIIYGRGGGANPKIARTQNVPPLGTRELRFCPPSDPSH